MIFGRIKKLELEVAELKKLVDASKKMGIGGSFGWGYVQYVPLDQAIRQLAEHLGVEFHHISPGVILRKAKKNEHQ